MREGSASEAADICRLGLGQMDIFFLKWTSGACDGVELKFEMQAHRIRALRVAGSSATGGWFSAEATFCLACSSASPLLLVRPDRGIDSQHISLILCKCQPSGIA